MLVGQTMTHWPQVCGPRDSLNRAAQIMWDHDCGCVPVVDPNNVPIGMITDRDVCMAAYTRGETLSSIFVEGAYSHGAVTVHDDDRVEQAEHLMSRYQVRRLPVIDKSGRLVGLLSIHDLAHKAALAPECVRELLASICRPRAARPLNADGRDPQRIQDIMTSPVYTCLATETLVRPAQLMWEHDCGAIPVTKHGDCVGMVTDRDICMAAYIQGKRLADIGILTAASHHAYSVRPTSSIAHAHDSMRMHRIRRLPVIDAGHNLVGIVSLADIANNPPRSPGAEEGLRADMLTDTLACIGHWHDESPRRSKDAAVPDSSSEVPPPAP
jgi:CBS domain-containing protein